MAEGPHDDDLLARAMSGDRDAMAVFIQKNEDRIRRRLRGKLSYPARRILDSHDLIQILAVEMDQYIVSGRFSVGRPNQLWALIFRIADRAAAREAGSAMRRVSSERPVEEPGLLADHRTRPPRDTIADCSSSSGLERELQSLWLQGYSLAAIAWRLDVAPSTVRKRWQRFCARARRRAEFDK